ncbi:glycoside hydrolase family 113 [Marinoscillum furvescens]|uniref:Glycoside hydrolase n=1 Tax=Marinoscillum furvescens DSM 4134 TaxID=1122208 RepID=A0A3D9LGH0_MARFU|nr:hypothetical protein [Marinoscillum furvescens]REE05780.1 hypothetical protein C7460_101299 [Marinoscillum furvescens DSM 4134]
MKLIVGFFLIVCVMLVGYFLIDPSVEVPVKVSKKINGVSLVNPRRPAGKAALCDVQSINADWVAVIPFGFSVQGEPSVYFDTERQWWGERLEGTRQLIRDAKSCSLKVMVKPHVWLRRGWIGEFSLQQEQDWLEWENAYTKYVLAFAQLAEAEGAPMFCIGTEYKRAVRERPHFWPLLIEEVKKVYSGKLTYAANWDDYDEVAFWAELDYIGVDAYFPLEISAKSDLKAVTAGWKKWADRLTVFAHRQGRPVLFTEYGYQSRDGALDTPWGVPRSYGEVVDLDVQCMGYEALYQSVWKESWFAGGFLWKWHLDSSAGGFHNADFTPQGKPVEAIISKWYH